MMNMIASLMSKDSAFQSHVLKYKYMNPLTVTWAPHLYTILVQNHIGYVGGLIIIYSPLIFIETIDKLH